MSPIDILKYKYGVAFNALTNIAAGSTNPQGVARDALQVCVNAGDTSDPEAKCEGCDEAIATTFDSEGIPLCEKCARLSLMLKDVDRATEEK